MPDIVPEIQDQDDASRPRFPLQGAQRLHRDGTIPG